MSWNFVFLFCCCLVSIVMVRVRVTNSYVWDYGGVTGDVGNDLVVLWF